VRGEGFEVLRRNVGKEADNILHTVLGRQRNIKRIAYQVESAWLNAVFRKNEVLRIQIVRQEKPRGLHLLYCDPDMDLMGTA
jgi:hypothetical protein